MAEKLIDAAFLNQAGDAVFFLADQYVVFDYAQGSAGRVRDGVHGLDAFPPGSTSGFPPDFAPPGPSTRLDAAVRGRDRFADASYFFRGTTYMRLRTVPAPSIFEPPAARPLALWNLPRGFLVKGAFNGARNRERFCYFFDGKRYIRYVWADEKPDRGYPKPLSSMVGMPPSFAGGIDSAVDGGGRFSDAGYLFKGDRYLRFQWVNGAGEPHVDGEPRPIQDNWPGLVELLLSGKAKSQALEWLRVTQVRLASLVAGSILPADAAVLTAALATHFHTTPSDAASIATITATLAGVEATLRNGATMFRFRTDAEALADGNPAVDAAYTAPWPPSAATRINFTRNFKRRSERNRASSIIHEAVHVNDPASNTPATHINEWYVTAATAPALGLTPIAANLPQFATRYDLMTTTNALHNPASYATFARHNFFRVDQRENP